MHFCVTLFASARAGSGWSCCFTRFSAAAKGGTTARAAWSAVLSAACGLLCVSSVLLCLLLPGAHRMEHHDRFAHDIQKIVDTAVAQLKDLYHEHSRLMITIHTTLATRHIFHGLTHLIHEYADAGLLSPRFREDTDRQLEKQLDNIETFFDANPLKRLQFSVQERWNIIVRDATRHRHRHRHRLRHATPRHAASRHADLHANSRLCHTVRTRVVTDAGAEQQSERYAPDG